MPIKRNQIPNVEDVKKIADQLRDYIRNLGGFDPFATTTSPVSTPTPTKSSTPSPTKTPRLTPSPTQSRARSSGRSTSSGTEDNPYCSHKGQNCGSCGYCDYGPAGNLVCKGLKNYGSGTYQKCDNYKYCVCASQKQDTRSYPNNGPYSEVGRCNCVEIVPSPTPSPSKRTFGTVASGVRVTRQNNRYNRGYSRNRWAGSSRLRRIFRMVALFMFRGFLTMVLFFLEGIVHLLK